MEIYVEWHDALPLRDGSKEGLIYTCDLDEIPEDPGVYVFARKHGEHTCPLYIGQSHVLRRRIDSDLDRVRLMRGVEEASSGSRLLLFCTLNLRPGQQVDKVLDIVEYACISHALSEGHELLNKQGTSTRTHSIHCYGRQDPKRFPFPRQMNHRME